MIWTARHQQFEYEMLGFLPSFLNENDPRPAAQQFDANYQHGGGWQPMEGWTLADDDMLKYPGDPPQSPLAETRLRDERILFYPHAFVSNPWQVRPASLQTADTSRRCALPLMTREHHPSCGAISTRSPCRALGSPTIISGTPKPTMPIV